MHILLDLFHPKKIITNNGHFLIKSYLFTKKTKSPIIASLSNIFFCRCKR